MTAPLRSAHSSIARRLALMVLALLAGCQKAPDLALTFQLHTGAAAPSNTDLAEARDAVQKRLSELGVRSAEVETTGVDRLTVRIPREDDSQRLRSVLMAPAVLELRLVRLPADLKLIPSEQEVLGHYGGRLPPDLELLTEGVRGTTGTVTRTRYYAVERKAVLTGRDIRAARPGLGPNQEHLVEFAVKPEPAKAFAEATGAHVGSFLAIVLDGRVVSAPVINAKIGENGVIQGSFTAEQAEDLSIVLRSGPLPGRLTLVEARAPGSER
jgi:preprotein translocase subunit SecD